MTTIYKQQTKQGWQYTHDGKVIRNSKREYRFALMCTPKKALGATADGKPFVRGLGNNPASLRSSWASISSHTEMQVVEIENI